ncbi:MAG: DUF1722 domain-containing protein [Chitinivibrionales bacterium]|nr:DUF1722 domain-containing protein [Chitinivibrionales bacterium]
MNINIGISSCLLGEKVRYDGGHKRERYLTDVLGKYVTWVPVCPEHECGLSIPRESMRLVRTENGIRLVTTRTKKDHTDKMTSWAGKRIRKLQTEDLCGFIFKTKSPSSAMKDAKVYSAKGGMAEKKMAGLFAGMVMDKMPYLPCEDEGRLNDDTLRENFIERVFVFARWKDATKNSITAVKLIDFHSDHKLTLMSHSPARLKELGKIVASIDKKMVPTKGDEYLRVLMDAMATKSSVRKHTNVLYHIMGYFKKVLTKEEKQELGETIENYHNHLVPLIVPVTLLNHYTRKYGVDYLQRQVYLHPHPAELKLRNHV